jgi:recombination protein RecA
VPKQSDAADPLAKALADIDRKYGAGSLMRLGDPAVEVPTVKTFSTGSISLDEALGIGGLPLGRIIELYGPEMSGKTTIALTAIACLQRDGMRAAIIDAEHALSLDWARTCGVDVDELYVNQPDNAEEGLEIADMLARSKAFGAIVIDSVAALVPRAELEGEMGDTHVGLQARLMSQALRKLTPVLADSGTSVLFINQLREKVGVFFGNPEVTSGGKALKFYASIRLDVRRIETLKDGTDNIGNRVKITVSKNKLSPPFRRAEVDLLFASGISREGELIDLGVQRGVLRKSGAWYTTEPKAVELDPPKPQPLQLGQGKEKAREYLILNNGLADRIEKAIRARPASAGGNVVVVAKEGLADNGDKPPFVADKASGPV